MVINEFPDEDSELLKSLFDYVLSSGSKKTYLEIIKYIDNLEAYGLQINRYFKKEAIKTLDKDIYELRPDKIRITFTIVEGEAWLLSWFIKKSNKTPKLEIKIAQQRRKKLKNNLK